MAKPKTRRGGASKDASGRDATESGTTAANALAARVAATTAGTVARRATPASTTPSGSAPKPAPTPAPTLASAGSSAASTAAGSTRGSGAPAPTPTPASTSSRPAEPPAQPGPAKPLPGQPSASGGTPDPPATTTLPRAVLSAADVQVLRDRLNAVIHDGVSADTLPADETGKILSQVAKQVAAARAKDAAHIAELETGMARLRKAAEAESSALRANLAAAIEATDAAVAEVASVREIQAQLADELQKSAKLLARAQARITELEAKPAPDAAQPVGAEALAELVDNFITSLGDRLGSLSLAGGDMVLKTAVVPTSGGARFVLPSAVGPAPPVLQELRLRLEPKG